MKTISVHEINPELKGANEYSNYTKQLKSEYNKRSYTHRLMCITGGNCSFICNGMTFQCDIGDMIYFPPFEPYGNDFSGNDFRAINLFFDFLPYRADSNIYCNIIADADFEAQYMGEKLVFTDCELFNLVRYISGYNESILKTAEICREYNERRICAKQRSNALLTELLISLMRFGENGSRESPNNRTDAILDYINRNCRLPLSGKMLSETFNYHPNYINRLVKTATSMTLHEYITDTKIHHAAVLLRETDEPITEIAMRYSFYDSSHFANVFRALVGVNPNEYRKLNRRQNTGVTYE